MFVSCTFSLKNPSMFPTKAGDGILSPGAGLAYMWPMKLAMHQHARGDRLLVDYSSRMTTFSIVSPCSMASTTVCPLSST